MKSEASSIDAKGNHAPRPGKRVAVVGAGGVIGSHLLPHLARMTDVERVVLIDGDSYEPSNLYSQDIALPDIGERKVAVQARRMRRVNPSLQVIALPHRVEEIPAGLLRADAVLACLDSRSARQYVNEIAWRLGAPWIDAGVDGDNLLARINVYLPSRENPCLECGWGPRDYELIEQKYACSSLEGAASHGFSTNAPSHLGALAASLQIAECRKVLDGVFDPASAAEELLVDARHKRLFRTSARRNPDCLMDHSVWALDKAIGVPESAPLSELPAFRNGARGNAGSFFQVLGSRFVKRLTCTACGTAEEVWRLQRSIAAADRNCPACGGMRVAAGFDVADRLSSEEVPESVLRRPLGEVGMRREDILRVLEAGEEHWIEVIAG
ncbi:MAG: ThiF family adenylyltransferase [Candidatus Eisenbacteria bacterium]|nr:ThiF family adenylyltransferase [Candidatus Eisenbacteria bacterium]